MKSFDEIYALATAAPHSELAETFTDPRLSWGVGVTQGVAVAMQEAQAEIERLRAELAAKDDAISRFKAGLIRAGAKVPIDAMTMNAHEQGLSIALVCLESELDRAAKRKYDLASIISRGEQDDEN